MQRHLRPPPPDGGHRCSSREPRMSDGPCRCPPIPVDRAEARSVRALRTILSGGSPSLRRPRPRQPAGWPQCARPNHDGPAPADTFLRLVRPGGSAPEPTTLQFKIHFRRHLSSGVFALSSTDRDANGHYGRRIVVICHRFACIRGVFDLEDLLHRYRRPRSGRHPSTFAHRLNCVRLDLRPVGDRYRYAAGSDRSRVAAKMQKGCPAGTA
jgi:hypothetical protein